MTTKPIGGLRHLFLLEGPVETPDGAGGVTRSFAEITRVWGSMQMRSQSERWQADREEQAATFTVTLRYRPNITAGMRLRSGANVYDIRAAHDAEGRMRWLTCLVEEVTP